MTGVMINYVVPVIHVLACLFLIVVVLLQTGKGADMGAVFGGGSQTLFGSSGAGNFLTKLTTGTAIAGMRALGAGPTDSEWAMTVTGELPVSHPLAVPLAKSLLSIVLGGLKGSSLMVMADTVPTSAVTPCRFMPSLAV